MSQNVWATIMPFGPVTNFLLAQKCFSGQPKAGLISGSDGSHLEFPNSKRFTISAKFGSNLCCGFRKKDDNVKFP